jgi:putative transposase
LRGVFYTRNATGTLNSKLQQAGRARGHLPSDESATKLLFLVLNHSEKEWIMPPREGCSAKPSSSGERCTRAKTFLLTQDYVSRLFDCP